MCFCSIAFIFKSFWNCTIILVTQCAEFYRIHSFTTVSHTRRPMISFVFCRLCLKSNNLCMHWYEDELYLRCIQLDILIYINNSWIIVNSLKNLQTNKENTWKEPNDIFIVLIFIEYRYPLAWFIYWFILLNYRSKLLKFHTVRL